MDLEITQKSISVLNIATGKYFEYWKKLAVSIEQHLFLDSKVTIHIFTDAPNRVSEIATKRIEIVPHRIENLGWPDATLLRYEIFDKARGYLNDEFLMYLDADMLVLKDLNFIDLFPNNDLGMLLVAHPGFWRPYGIELIQMYIRKPAQFIRDLRLFILQGSLGTWERRVNSKAFTPRSKRKLYVCGGTWLGQRDSFLEMISILASQVREDNVSGVTALWHDESHLNSWAANNPHRILPPNYCFDFSYEWLKGLSPIIEAVHKSNSSDLKNNE